MVYLFLVYNNQRYLLVYCGINCGKTKTVVDRLQNLKVVKKLEEAVEESTMYKKLIEVA